MTRAVQLTYQSQPLFDTRLRKRLQLDRVRALVLALIVGGAMGTFLSAVVYSSTFVPAEIVLPT